jgi:Zn ribbon nucleic-acid-binding protein
MGSVIDYIECPNCDREAFSDFYYKTGEEYVNCNNCGYHYSATIKDRTKRLDELEEDDFEIKELKNPFGAYRIKYYDSPGYTCGSLGSEKQLNELKTNGQQDDSIEYFSVSRFIDGDIKVETIIDNGPKYDSAGFSIEDRFEDEAGGMRDCGNDDDEGDFFN